MPAPDPQFGRQPYDRAELSSYTPSWRDQIAYALADIFPGLGDDRQGVRRAKYLTSALEMIPPVGIATGLNEAARSGERGDYAGAGFELAMAGIPIKGAGKLAKAAKVGVGLPREAGIAARQEAIRAKYGYDPAKIAENYPDIAPPAPAIDPKTGKEFLQKQLSAEAQALDKARKHAQKEIDKGNYTPHFKLEDRYYANPENYPLEGRTLTDALPKKQATIDKYKAEFDTPEVRERLKGAFVKAKGDPLAVDWYAVGQLEDEFVKELGPEQGRAMFKEAFADAMAATTGGSTPTSNLLMAYYANFKRQRGEPLPENTYNLPYPIGGRYAAGNIAMYDKVINQGQGLKAPNNPKRFDFSGNFQGHRDRATIDEQMSGLYKPGMAIPPGDSYGVVEGVLHDVAREEGVMPANFQDVAWAGATGRGGKPMMQDINEAIERTSRVTGKDPKDVVRDSLVRRTHPLYGVSGLFAAGAGAAALGSEDEGGGGW